MRFLNLTAQTEIGANSYLLEIAGKKILLDAGLHPKREGLAALPSYRLVEDSSLAAIIISHAHQDHIGSLPWIMRRQPQARVFMTQATARLSEVMLHNSVNVMQRQRDDLKIADYPLFTHREVEKASARWQRLSLSYRWTLEGERAQDKGPEPTFEFFDSGHIIGAAGVLFRVDGKRVFYTGDVNFIDQTLAQRAEFPTERLDTLIIECTRGDRPSDPDFTRQEEEERFLCEIKNAFARGGAVLVPVFALGKTQEVLAMIYQFRRNGQMNHSPVYIGGLSTKVTVVHDELSGSVPRQLSGLTLLSSIDPFVLGAKEIATTQVRQNRIFALSSGMMTEKTLSNVLAARFLSDPKHSVFFVGYADPDSPGGRLKAARPEEPFRLDKDLPSQRLACTVKEFNFSAHASRESLLAYVRLTSPRVVFLVHGDPPSVGWFKDTIDREMPETKAIIPVPGEVYDV